MPVCHHKQQNLTTLASEEKLFLFRIKGLQFLSDYMGD